jgi:small subunit ribosomal protein S16
MGRKNRAFFRLNAMDSRSPRDGRVIEELGFYDPRAKDEAKQFVVNLDRCKHWLDVGAIPSETVSSLLKKNGLNHKHLRLPKPGKPKVAAVAAEKKGGEAQGQPKHEEAKKEEAAK